MPEGYILSERDVKVLRQIAERERQRRLSPNLRGGQAPDELFTPEVYVAQEPTDVGTGTDAGTGTSDVSWPRMLDVFRLDEETGELIAVPGLTRLVNKLPDGWTLIHRDKFGQWYLGGDEDSVPFDPDHPPPDFAGSPKCEFARILPTDCVIASGSKGSVLLRPYGGTWIGDELFEYFDTSGAIEFWYESGRPHLSVAGLELLDCCNGCFTGGPWTGHYPAHPVSMQSCKGLVFTVCITCHCCYAKGYKGPGWYCVRLLGSPGTGTTAADCDPYYLTDEFACDPDVYICSGPYNTYAEAAMRCGFGTGTGTGTGSQQHTVGVCCSHGATASFTLSGISGLVIHHPFYGDRLCRCDDVNGFNRTWTLTWDGFSNWSETTAPLSFYDPDDFCAQGKYVVLSCDDAGSMLSLIFYFGVDEVARYEAPRSSFKCPGTNRFTFASVVCTICCSGWPAFIDVTMSSL